MNRFARGVCLGLTLGGFALSGCGEAEPAPPPKVEAPKPAAPEHEAKHKGKKNADPTADMGIRELREYRKQHPDAGKTP